MKKMNEKCPDTNTLAEFVEGKLLEKKHAELGRHIAGCPECRDLCTFAVMANGRKRMPQVAVRRRNGIRQNIKREVFAENTLKARWEEFSSRVSGIFKQVECAEVIAAGESAAAVNFACEAETPAEYNWKMVLNIPATCGGDLDIRVRTAKDPAVSGKLIFCGNELTVTNGRATIGYETLKNSFANPEVAFIFANNTRVAGFPML